MPRLVRVVGPAALLLVALLATLAGLAYGGGAAAQLLADPGPVVRWGLPVAKLLVNLGAAGTIGALVLTAFALSPREREFNSALDFAAASAAVLTVAAALTGFFTFLQVTNVPLSFDDRFSATMGQFISQIEIGQAWLGTTLIAAGVTVLCFAVRNQTALVFVTALAVGALVPLAQQGHSAGAAGPRRRDHGPRPAPRVRRDLARRPPDPRHPAKPARRRTSRHRSRPVLHARAGLLRRASPSPATSAPNSASAASRPPPQPATACSCWQGGRADRARRLRRDPPPLLHRRIGRSPEYASAAGSGGLSSPSSRSWASPSGVAAALATTATPVDRGRRDADPDAPPRREIAHRRAAAAGAHLRPLLHRVEPRPRLVLFCAFGIFFYLAGVTGCAAAATAWPFDRTVLWVAGHARAVLRHQRRRERLRQVPVLHPHARAHGADDARARAARARRPRHAGRCAPSASARTAAAGRASGSCSPCTPARRCPRQPVRRRRPLRRLAVGVLLHAAVQLGDHRPHRARVDDRALPAHRVPVRAVADRHRPGSVPPAATRSGCCCCSARWRSTPSSGWRSSPGPGCCSPTGTERWGAWGPSAIADQQAGGGIAWSIGELPTIALAIAVAIQWSRGDEKEARRGDRNADRTDDAELEAYNESLARLAARDQR